MAFCLTKEEILKFRRALKDGTLKPADLIDMSSEQRRALFDEITGKYNSEHVNRLFESKMLLKNQQQGLITWAKTVAGMKPEVRRDIIARIERMDEKLLNPTEEKIFLRDLAAQRLGVNVSFEEVKEIHRLADKVKDLEQYKGSSDKEKRLEYGRAADDLQTYVNDRKVEARTMSWREIARQPKLTAVGLGLKKIGQGIASNSKAIQASMDDSAIFRQGWKTLWTNPVIWQRNARQTFVNLFKFYKPVAQQHSEVMHELHADIMSRPTYDQMRQAKLDVVGLQEEAYPTSLPEKIPLIGRVYKATENAYTAFVQKTRADVFDKMIALAENNGVDLTHPEELQAIGKLVNSLTGRGHLGKLEGIGKEVNTVFFSAKLLKSHFDVLTQPVTGAGGSAFVRKEAAKNLAKMAFGLTLILAIAKFFDDDSVELDPRSADFGKIKIGNTRFEVAGGMSSVLVLLSRLATQQTKDSKGKVRGLMEPEYGKQDLLDVVVDFFTGKVAPVGGMIRDFARGETFEGAKPTVGGQALNLFTPLPIKTLGELIRDPEARQDKRFVAAATLADMLGIGVNVRGKRPKGKDKPNDIDLHILSTFLFGAMEEKGSVDDYLKSNEFKRSTTDDIVYDIQTNRSEEDRPKMIEALRKKAANAHKAGTLTQKEADAINALPEFENSPVTPRDTKGKKVGGEVKDKPQKPKKSGFEKSKSGFEGGFSGKRLKYDGNMFRDDFSWPTDDTPDLPPLKPRGIMRSPLWNARQSENVIDRRMENPVTPKGRFFRAISPYEDSMDTDAQMNKILDDVRGENFTEAEKAKAIRDIEKMQTEATHIWAHDLKKAAQIRHKFEQYKNVLK